MASNVFILHGSYGSPYENWFPWLYNIMSEKGVQSFVPFMPSPLNQNFDNWSFILDGYFDTKILNNESLLIGHSSACPMLLKYAQSRKIFFDSLITVCGFNNFLSGNIDFDNINSSFFLSEDDLSDSGNYFRKKYSFYSSTDPFLPLDNLQNFSRRINSQGCEIKDAGHFNSSSGYSKFEAILPVIEDFLADKNYR